MSTESTVQGRQGQQRLTLAAAAVAAVCCLSTGTQFCTALQSTVGRLQGDVAVPGQLSMEVLHPGGGGTGGSGVLALSCHGLECGPVLCA